MQIATINLDKPEHLDLFMSEVERRLSKLSDENMVLKVGRIS